LLGKIRISSITCSLGVDCAWWFPQDFSHLYEDLRLAAVCVRSLRLKGDVTRRYNERFLVKDNWSLMKEI